MCQAWGRGRESGLGQQGGGDVAESGAAREGPAVFSLLQPRNVAGFRGTVRYASVNAHKNRVSGRAGPEEAGAAGPRSGAERAAGEEGRAGGRRGGERSTGQRPRAGTPETLAGRRLRCRLPAAAPSSLCRGIPSCLVAPSMCVG